MIQYTAEELYMAAEENGFMNVLTGMGVTPHVRLPIDKAFLEQPLEVLDLSLRAWNGLMRAGITDIQHLVDRLSWPNGLSNIRNFGKKSIAEVKSKLTELAYEQLTEPERISFWQYFIDNSNSIPRSQLYAEA